MNRLSPKFDSPVIRLQDIEAPKTAEVDAWDMQHKDIPLEARKHGQWPVDSILSDLNHQISLSNHATQENPLPPENFDAESKDQSLMPNDAFKVNAEPATHSPAVKEEFCVLPASFEAGKDDHRNASA